MVAGIIVVVALLIFVAVLFMQRPAERTYLYSDIIGYFEDERVSAYSLDFGTGEMQLQVDDIPGTVTYYAPSPTYMQEKIDPYVEAYNRDHETPMVQDLQRAQQNTWLLSMLPMVVVVVIMFVAYFYMMRKLNAGMGDAGKQMNFGRAKVKKLEDEKRKTTFADVAGADEEKEELSEIVEFLKNPRKYNELGARIPKGVLLVGPPGTGKTLLARAVAGEAGVPFFSISGSDFVEMFVGVGASRVRDLFDQAKRNSPCIVFIDEIDAVGRQRGAVKPAARRDGRLRRQRGRHHDRRDEPPGYPRPRPDAPGPL